MSDISASRCGGIGRHAVLRGQWGKLRASSSLAIGTAFFVLLTIAPMPAQALLLGENARYAKTRTLKQVRRYYQKGLSHDEIWKKTGWYCPQGVAGKCRWEISDKCTGVNKINLNSLERTESKGAIPLHRIFKATCIYKQYPSMRKGIEIYLGDCKGWGGFASRRHGDEIGKICISTQWLQIIEEARRNTPSISIDKSRDPKAVQKLYQDYRNKIEQAKKELHSIFIHEMQHHIQFAENWSVYDTRCPYESRQLEVEAYYVDDREYLSQSQKRQKAPHWWHGGLC